MKQSVDHLSTEELENLCRLFLDCRLSVLEETELEYVLLRVKSGTPLIEETKRLMRISRSVRLREPLGKPKRTFRRKHFAWGIRAAACIAILLGGLALLRGSGGSSSAAECVVYVSGQKVCGEEAYAIAEADVSKMERFKQAVAEQQAAEEAKVKQFMNNITIEK